MNRTARAPCSLAPGFLIVAAVLAAYANSLAGPFVFDDLPAILDNPTIRSLGGALSPPPGGYTVSGRPLVNLSLAVNYAISGTDVWGYHLLNIAIHCLAALVLYGIVRRTPISGFRFQVSAFLVALLWAVHPLQTESVTYVVQRAESLMGLFYLLTLYCFIRYAEAGRPDPVLRSQARTEPPSFVPRCGTSEGGQAGKRPWAWLSIGACLLGMASKEVMVSAPVIVLLYDRAFVAGSLRAALAARRRYYAALASTWLLLAWLVLRTGTRGATAGTGIGMSPSGYWLTQFQAIVHYLRLVFWPDPLVLDYGTGLAPSAVAVLPQILAVLALAGGAAWLLLGDPGREPRRASAGFALAWFIAVLLPTSAVPVVVQVMAEHRMYLALAPVIALVVLALGGIPGRRLRISLAAGAVIAAAALGARTAARNADYRSPLSLWRATASLAGGNARAHYNAGLALASEGRADEAIAEYREAVRILPGYTEARNNLGIALTQAGRWEEAIPEYEEAARLDPASGRTRYNLGNALLHLGRPDEAIAAYGEALRLSPGNPSIEYNLGLACARAGRLPEAIAAYRRALELRPGFADALFSLGRALARTGDWTQALACYEEAAAAGYSGAPLEYGQAQALAQLGRPGDALPHLEAAVRQAPDDAGLHNELGCALAQAGRFGDARREFEAALGLAPGDASARANLERLPPER
jgi:protein O-mannosyl-transferase